nr:hypothetical protein 16 [bacterium]
MDNQELHDIAKQLGYVNATLRKLVKLLEVSLDVEMTSNGYEKRETK